MPNVLRDTIARTQWLSVQWGSQSWAGARLHCASSGCSGVASLAMLAV
jgi:hypothetical protein